MKSNHPLQESVRNSTVVDVDGSNEVQLVELTPKNWYVKNLSGMRVRGPRLFREPACQKKNQLGGDFYYSDRSSYISLGRLSARTSPMAGTEGTANLVSSKSMPRSTGLVVSSSHTKQ
jgi:hypothetical protein